MAKNSGSENSKNKSASNSRNTYAENCGSRNMQNRKDGKNKKADLQICRDYGADAPIGGKYEVEPFYN